MAQYLTEIKSLVDQIAAAGSTVDAEDIILYILNGLPSTYQSFKTSIRTMLTPIGLDQFYSLLLSEEIHVASDASCASSFPDPKTALFTYRGRGRRGRGQNFHNNNRPANPPSERCQICLKKGYSASSCWHRLNLQYTPANASSAPKALLASSDKYYTN
ncbi:hypothetical protein M5K25_016558 [Dendrobium thyrsiflorum]|uniref:Retrovirus-related Pol polyprotein from transposon TNT 1-94 n=1 Tax=Dendrobium thyrsiflorum TaxID=117978 RepID=A0ABD0UK23_DENTH